MRSTARQLQQDAVDVRDAPAERLKRAYVAHALAGLLPHRRAWRLKRALDLAITAPLLLVTWPVALVIALGLRVRFHGQPTVTCACVGRGGRLFALRQFRAKSGASPAWSADETSAWQSVSRLGKLPALRCALAGRMSLVGPAPWRAEAFADCPTGELARLYVAPGMVRLRPVGRLGRLATTQAEADQLYVTHGSLWVDLQQLGATVFLPTRHFAQMSTSPASDDRKESLE